MASSTRVPPTEITGIYGALLKTMSRRILGQVPEGAGVMWHYPAVFKDMMKFGRRTESWNRLDPQLASFATMAAAGAVGCSFCLDLHYFMTHNRGLDEAKARQVPRWREATVFTPLERRVMEYAEAMSQTPLTVTDEYLGGWLEADDSDGELGGLFEELGALWTEAILSADLSKQERAAWAKRLTAWQKELDEYSIEGGFDAAAEAARQGWDYPPLLRVLQGEITERGAWEAEDSPYYADELAQARLKVLERQGRTQEYLYLAEGEGQVALYVAMLAKLGRVEEALNEGLQYLGTTDDALLVAKALREYGAVDAALRIAEHGLTLQGAKTVLARWLRDAAGAAGQPERGLAAALAVVREMPSLADYLAVAPLAGDRWPAVREELLAEMRTAHSFFPSAPVQILLHEGELDAALALVEPGGTHSMVELVIDAAIKERPEWAIDAGRRQALRIIDAGKAPYYGAAADWLRKAGEAAKVAGRADEWRALVRDLLNQHSRKRNLVPLLENLLRGR